MRITWFEAAVLCGLLVSASDSFGNDPISEANYNLGLDPGGNFNNGLTGGNQAVLSFDKSSDSFGAVTDSSNHVNFTASAIMGKLGIDYTASADANQLSADTTGLNRGAGAGATAAVTAGFSDWLVWHAPGLPIGTPIGVFGILNVHGNFGIDFQGPPIGLGSASFELDLSGNGLQSPFLVLAKVAQRSDHVGDNQSLYPSTIPFEYFTATQTEQNLTYILKLTAYNDAERAYSTPGLTSSSLSVSYGDTVSWGGVTSVVNLNTRKPIDGWSVTSLSGADYSHAIPEPATLLLAAFGGLALACRQRRA